MSMTSTSISRLSKRCLPALLGALTLASLATVTMPVAAQSARAKAALPTL